jgi:glycerol kinase
MEEDLQDMVDSTRYCIQQALSKLSTTGRSVSDVKGVGITNQRETACVWSRSSGKPLHPAIVWLDARTAPTVKALGSKTEHGMDVLKKRTGLPLSTYFSAVKLRWLLDNVDAVREAHAKDDLMFGTVDTWMLWNLTGGMDGGLFLTDVTNASRTMLMDLETLDWDADALSFFGIKRSCLADIVSCSQVYGQMAHGPLEGVPIAGMIGDQQAALVGQKCLSLGESKNTYGTGCFLLYNTGTDIVPSNHGLLTTVR